MTNQDSTDRRLVDAVLGGDTDAFRYLVQRDSHLVVGVCRRVLSDPNEAEEVAQEAFLRAWQSLATFRGDGSFGAWVTKIAVRQAVTRLASRRDHWSLDDEAHPETAASIRSTDDLEAVAIDLDWRRELWATVADLPAPQREAVVLRFGRDLSIDEIAALTGSPTGTVKSRLHRAFGTLRDRMGSRPAE